MTPKALINPLLVGPTGGGLYRTKLVRIFSKLPIRDTVSHDGQFMLPMLDTGNLFFDVLNTHNQAVTVELVTGGWGGYVGATRIGLPETVAANRSEGFTVAADSTWGPWVGIQLSFGTAPTSGFVTVMISQRELQAG